MNDAKEASIYWNRPYGWRAGTRYIEPGASAVDVIRHEREELGNDLDVPDFLLEELTRKQVRAKDIVWVCRTQQHARRYSGRGRGQAYKEDFGANALILATDHEPETGYLVLTDARLLDWSVVQQYAIYRRVLRGDGVLDLGRERMQAFQALRSEVHRQMETKIQARLDEGRDRPTDFELELDAFEEEIEPQVWNAVKVMNKKGYETVSSGFAGVYGERQQIDGSFSVDDVTKERLALMGVAVIPYPDPYMDGQMIIFHPEKPNLPEITATWNHIARLLPNLKKPRRNTR